MAPATLRRCVDAPMMSARHVHERGDVARQATLAAVFRAPEEEDEPLAQMLPRRDDERVALASLPDTRTY